MLLIWIKNEILTPSADVVEKANACANKQEKLQIILQILSAGSEKGWKNVVGTLNYALGKYMQD